MPAQTIEHAGGGGAPQYLALDEFDLLCWRFQETASPYVNIGALGTAQNMVDVTGDGTVYQGGQPDGHFGKGLKFAMSAATSAALRAPSSVWPTGNITVSVWVTISRLLGANNVGRLFHKAANVSFTTPFLTASFEWNTTDSFHLVKDNTVTPVTVQNTLPHNSQGLTLNVPHHLVMTFGDGALKSYIDGALVRSTSSSATLDLKTGPWGIGNYNVTAEHVGGIYHEVRVSSVVRSAEWVRQYWNLARP